MSGKKTISPVRRATQGSTVIQDPAKVMRVLGVAKEHFPRGVLQLKGGDHKTTIRLTDRALQQGHFYLESVDADSERELKAFLPYGEPGEAEPLECNVLLFISGQFLLGVPTRYEGKDLDGYRFAAPKRLIKIQRRKDTRLNIPAGYEIFIHINSLADTRGGPKRLVDIGESGLAFETSSPEEAARFKVGQKILGVFVTLQQRRMVVDIEVRNQFGRKVGVQFTRISAEDREFIAGYVFSQVDNLLADL